MENGFYLHRIFLKCSLYSSSISSISSSSSSSWCSSPCLANYCAQNVVPAAVTQAKPGPPSVAQDVSGAALKI